MPNPLLEAALAYAHLGWAIHPLRPGDKKPILDDWPHQATADPDTIRAWWQRWPAANIGLACGPSGLVVVDLDVKNGAQGLASWAALGVSGDTLASSTPSGGRHLLYAYNNGAPIPNSAGKLGPGIDTRGEGGYIVLPPSRVGGRPYAWERSPDDCPPAPLPLALAALLRKLTPAPRPAPAPVAHVGAYARAALDGELAKVRAAREGERNEVLNRAAFALGQLAAVLDLGTAQAQLLAAALEIGLGEREALATILSGLAAGSEQPREVPERAGRPAPSRAAHQATAPETDHGGRPLTDLGNAERLVDRHGAELRYCWPWGKWLAWDGRRWAPDDTGEVARRAKDTVRAIYREAAAAVDEDARKAIGKWALRSEGENRIKAMIELARSEPGIPVLPDALDADPWLLAVGNGTLDLRTGRLGPSDPGRLITRLAPVVYDPDARAPTWERFLSDVMDGDAAMIDFLQRAVGYSLTGDTREQVLFILYGSGANGKSTLLETLAGMLGDYANATPPETLLTRAKGAIPNDVARLRGARLVTAVEAEEGARLAESLVKQMTGGDTLTARFMRAEWFEFRPEFKLFLATNHKPVIRGADAAIWRRIRLVPFEVSFPEELQDRDLAAKLRGELPGILAWAVWGCLAWQRAGLGVPDKVRAATADYRTEMDALSLFLEDCCLVKPTASAKAAALYSAYESWCQAYGENRMEKRTFGRRLGERGFIQDKGTGGTRLWRGVGLLTDPEQLDLLDEVGAGHVEMVF